MNIPISACRLCGNSEPSKLNSWTPKRRPHRQFQRCQLCDYVQCHAQELISSEDEKQRYQEHNNNDSDYRNFMREWLKGQLEELRTITGHKKTIRVLDYGSGPYPMMREVWAEYFPSHQFEIYDPFFHPSFPIGKFDIIILHEVIEHLHFPKQVALSLQESIFPQTKILVRTQFFKDELHFEDWGYRRDPTHVGFFNQKSLSYWFQILNSSHK